MAGNLVRNIVATEDGDGSVDRRRRIGGNKAGRHSNDGRVIWLHGVARIARATWVTRGYMGSHGAMRGYMGSHGAMRGCKGCMGL